MKPIIKLIVRLVQNEHTKNNSGACSLGNLLPQRDEYLCYIVDADF